MTIAVSIRAVRITAILACAFGAAVLSWHFVRILAVFPGPAILAALVELPLLIVGSALVLVLRPVRAPSLTWSGAALAWGGTAAAGCALLANQGLIGLWAKGEGVGFAANWSASLSAPLNEEILKLCGVIMIVLAAPAVIRGPADGLIFGALTGLGFQVIENVTYGLNAIVLTGATNADQAVLNSVALRVGMTGLGSHWTMTAVAGAGIGYFVRYARQRLGRTGSLRPPRRGVLAAIACLATAMGMHLLFDAPGVDLLPKVAINFIVAVVLYLLLRIAFLSRARELLTDWTASGVVSATEARNLTSRIRRHRGLRRAGARQPGAPGCSSTSASFSTGSTPRPPEGGLRAAIAAGGGPVRPALPVAATCGVGVVMKSSCFAGRPVAHTGPASTSPVPAATTAPRGTPSAEIDDLTSGGCGRPARSGPVPRTRPCPSPPAPAAGRLWQPHWPRRRWSRLLSTALVVLLVPVSWSVGHALTMPGGGSVSERLAEWARDHYLGPLVTLGEWMSYQPPRVGGRPSFALTGPSAASRSGGDGHHSRAAGGSTAGGAAPPAPLTSLAGPALPGEGRWRVLGTVGGQAAIYGTYLRPSHEFSSYVAGIVSMNQRLLRFELRPGAEDPGPGPWHASSFIPRDASRGLLATFNGGFKIDVSGGGFYLNGTTRGTLTRGAASLVYYRDGHVAIGNWDESVRMTPQVTGVRQNLRLIVSRGRVPSSVDSNVESSWGATLGGGYYVWRSGIGITGDGRVIFAYGPALNVRELAELLRHAGAVTAMQLDINPEWMSYMYYLHDESAHPRPVNLLPDQMQPADRYYAPASRDFTAVYAR